MPIMDEVVAPPPVLPPACVITGQASPRQLPKARSVSAQFPRTGKPCTDSAHRRVIRVYGLIGPEHEDCPLWEMNWLPPGDVEVSSTAARSSSCLISEYFPEAGYEQEARKLLDELRDLVRSQTKSSRNVVACSSTLTMQLTGP